MTTVKLSKKNQMVLPREARERLGVGPGDEVVIIPRRNGGVLIDTPAGLFKHLRGSAKGIYGDVDEYLRRERASWGR